MMDDIGNYIENFRSRLNDIFLLYLCKFNLIHRRPHHLQVFGNKHARYCPGLPLVGWTLE